MKMKKNTKNIFAVAIMLLVSMSSYAAHKSCVGGWSGDSCVGGEGDCYLTYNPRLTCKVGNNTDCDKKGVKVRGIKSLGECIGNGASTIFTICVAVTPAVEQSVDLYAKC